MRNFFLFLFIFNCNSMYNGSDNLYEADRCNLFNAETFSALIPSKVDPLALIPYTVNPLAIIPSTMDRYVPTQVPMQAPMEIFFFQKEFEIFNQGNFEAVVEFNNNLNILFKLISLCNNEQIFISPQEMNQINSNLISNLVCTKLNALRTYILNNFFYENDLKFHFFFHSLILYVSSYCVCCDLQLSFKCNNRSKVNCMFQELSNFLNVKTHVSSFRYIMNMNMNMNYQLNFKLNFDSNLIEDWGFVSNNLNILLEVINDRYINNIPSLSLNHQQLVCSNNFFSFLQNRIICVKYQIILFLGTNIENNNQFFLSFNFRSLRLKKNKISSSLICKVSLCPLKDRKTLNDKLISNLKKIFEDNLFSLIQVSN